MARQKISRTQLHKLSKSQRKKRLAFCSKYGLPWENSSHTRAYRAKYLKEWRHIKKISKKYNSRTTGIKISSRQHKQKYKALKKAGGHLSSKHIQLVYEDNIKKYGTLTCYLCTKPIKFGEDELEHKIPLSRSGTNNYNNLGIAHKSCNRKKHNKTEKEYRKELKAL